MGGSWSEGLLDFYRGKKVLVTGDTGFKGSWLSWMLADAGAQVMGYALKPPTRPNLFDICGLRLRIDSRLGDVRDMDALQRTFDEFKPEFVFHLAAQPIVRDSYDDPRYTFETNVMGTVNLLECVRGSDSVRSVVNVTTDKVYLNADAPGHAFIEDEPLDGFDPYSNSKSCSELVTHSYVRSFDMPAVSTARAGNVLGGGDFAPHRIIPDCVRAMESVEPVLVRNPQSTRPFQHVLEPLAAYLLIAARQSESPELAGSYNVGPDGESCVSAGRLVQLWCDAWGASAGWYTAGAQGDGKHEAACLQLDNTKLKQAFGWSPHWDVERAVAKTVEWTRCWFDDGDADKLMTKQIQEFLKG